MTEAPWRFLPGGSCEGETPTCEYICNWADAAGLAITEGVLVAGGFPSLYSHSAGYLELRPDAGGLDAYVSFQLGTVYSPVSVRVFGRYEAAPGKSIGLYLRDFDAGEWDYVRNWDHTTMDGYMGGDVALGPKYVSGTGEVRVRWQTPDTDPGYRLYLDVARACHDREAFEQYEILIDCPGCPALSGTYIVTGIAGGFSWSYWFPEPIVCGARIISGLVLYFTYSSWLEPWNVEGMLVTLNIHIPGPPWIIASFSGYIYPPCACDLNALSLPITAGDPLGFGEERPIVSAVH